MIKNLTLITTGTLITTVCLSNININIPQDDTVKKQIMLSSTDIYTNKSSGNWVDYYANMFNGITINTYKDLKAVPQGMPLNKSSLFSIGDVLNKNGNKFVWPFLPFITGVDFHYQMPKVDFTHNKVAGSKTISKRNVQSKVVNFTVNRIKNDDEKLNEIVNDFSNIKIYLNPGFEKYVDAQDSWQDLTLENLQNIGTVIQDDYYAFVWPSNLYGAKISYKYDAYKTDNPIDQFSNGQIKIEIGKLSKIVNFQIGNHYNYQKDIKQKPSSGHVDFTFSFLLSLDEEKSLLGFNGNNPIYIDKYSMFSYLTGSTTDGARQHAPFAAQLWHDASYGGIETQQFLKQTIYDKLDDDVLETIRVRAGFGGATKLILKFSSDTHNHSNPNDPAWQTIGNEYLKAV